MFALLEMVVDPVGDRRQKGATAAHNQSKFPRCFMYFYQAVKDWDSCVVIVDGCAQELFLEWLHNTTFLLVLFGQVDLVVLVNGFGWWMWHQEEAF